MGRKPFGVNASFWPEPEDMWPGINDVTKYVVSKTMKKLDWKNSVFLDSVEDIKKLKKSEGRDLLAFGSANLVQTLLKNDLVDEIWVLINPLTLGTGNKLLAASFWRQCKL